MGWLLLLALAQEGARELEVVNPTSGAKLWAKVVAPRDASAEKKYPAVVIVSGGLGFGSQDRSPMALDAASKGLIVVHFDPDGRGKSEGTEDYGGKIQQDGLLAVIRAVRKLEFVESVGIVSLSLGIAMAAGVLGRYPDEPISFYIDWEGPADRFYITKFDKVFDRDAKVFGGHRTSDEEWWKEREAVRFAPAFRCPYLRIQTQKDHVHGPDFGHALLMIEAATSQKHGGKGRSPWTRVNGAENEPNTVYTKERPPKLLEAREKRKGPPEWLGYAVEILTRK